MKKLASKKYLDELQYARAFAIMGVLCVHGSSTGVGATPHDSIMFHIYNFINMFGKLGTPTFFFISSFVLFYTYYNKPLDGALLKRFYGNRLAYLLVPYFVFSLLYWGVKGYVYGLGNFEDEAKRLFWLIATGKAHTHLYFVFVSVQFYILFPILMYTFKKSRFVRKNAILLGIVLQILWVYLNSEFFKVEMKGSVCLSYIMPYFIGAYFGIYYHKIMEAAKDIKKSFVPILIIGVGFGVALCLHVGIMDLSRTGLVQFSNMWFEFGWGLYALFASLFVFILVHYLEIKAPVKVKKFLEGIGAVSFGIYLVHPFFLMVTRALITNGSPVVFHGWQVISYLIALFGSWAIVRMVYNYVPYSWILFGKDSSKRKAKTK
ncbi:acyltransferase [Priestia filamentosa]|uniref:acyltransferase family protein n=1 Tax=Priestia filamentosa TaxID=1402861 RepID=UPI0005896571